MSRLFVLGCSFTNYAWPTWADIIGLNFTEYENWAYPGLGNRAILERLSEIIATKNLTSDDTLIIQWTSHLRNDWHSTDNRHNTNVGWKTSGSIFNEINKKLYSDSWLSTFWDESSFAMHTLNCINLAQQVLENIQCTWLMTSMGYIHKLNSDYPTFDTTHGEKSKEELNLWENIPELLVYKSKIFDMYIDKWIEPVGVFSWNSKISSYKFKKSKGIDFYKDRHPTILQHKEYALKEVLPKLSCSQNLHPTVNIWIDKVEQCYINSHHNFTNFCKSIDWSNTYRGF